MGYGKTIDIKISDHKVQVRDYGRGIPLGKVIDCVSQINTGAKYNDDVFQFSVGLNGVGTKAVNALSKHFLVRSHRDGTCTLVRKKTQSGCRSSSSNATCGACCRQLVPISALEARELVRLVDRMPEPRRSVLRQRFNDALRRLADETGGRLVINRNDVDAEQLPFDLSPEAWPYGFLHQCLIGQLGLALGELWWLHDLAARLEAARRHQVSALPTICSSTDSSPMRMPNSVSIARPRRRVSGCWTSAPATSS